MEKLNALLGNYLLGGENKLSHPFFHDFVFKEIRSCIDDSEDHTAYGIELGDEICQGIVKELFDNAQESVLSFLSLGKAWSKTSSTCLKIISW